MLFRDDRCDTHAASKIVKAIASRSGKEPDVRIVAVYSEGTTRARSCSTLAVPVVPS